MLELIKEIDYAWTNNLTLYGVCPCKKTGYFNFRNQIISLYKTREMCNMKNTNLNRENLINIIARCNSKQVRRNWIHQMVSLTDIECSESQCTGCPIEKDCIEVCEVGGAF